VTIHSTSRCYVQTLDAIVGSFLHPFLSLVNLPEVRRDFTQASLHKLIQSGYHSVHTNSNRCD
jgi:hypothetical protein